MKFEESNTLLMNKIPDCFIYFLINKGEVVYVGQTTQGIIRPFSHKDKQFDSVRIMLCKKEELDILEDKFIKKYTPKYNKCYNLSMNYSLQRVKGIIQEATGDNKFYLSKLKKLIMQYNIPVTIDKFKGTAYLEKNDVELLLQKICCIK